MTLPLALWTGANACAEVGRNLPEDPADGVTGKALQRRSTQRALVVLPAPALTLEQACRLLKVLPTAAWEVVEAARRALVARAQPDQLRDLSTASCEALQDEARLVNLASQKLFEVRLGKVPDAGAAATGDSQAD